MNLYSVLKRLMGSLELLLLQQHALLTAGDGQLIYNQQRGSAGYQIYAITPIIPNGVIAIATAGATAVAAPAAVAAAVACQYRIAYFQKTISKS